MLRHRLVKQTSEFLEARSLIQVLKRFKARTPVALDLRGRIPHFGNQVVRGRKLVDLLEQSSLTRHISQAQVALEYLLVHAEGRSVFQKRFHLRGEYERIPEL